MSWFLLAHVSQDDKSDCSVALLQIPSRPQSSPRCPLCGRRDRGDTPGDPKSPLERGAARRSLGGGWMCREQTVTGCWCSGWVTPLWLGTLPQPWVSPLGATGSAERCGELLPQLGAPRTALGRAGLCAAQIAGGGWRGALWMSQIRSNQTRINPSMRAGG